MKRRKLVLELVILKTIVILSSIALLHCEKKPYDLKYPIKVNLYIDSTEAFGPYSPVFGPALILNVKNTGFDYIVLNELQNTISKSSFVPTYHGIAYFRGSIERPVEYTDKSSISESWNLVLKADTIRATQEKIYYYEPMHGTIFRDSISFILIQLPIVSPYFDSLNINYPFVYDRLYLEQNKKEINNRFRYSELKHPFFVFSTNDSLNLVNSTNAFIEKGILKLKQKPLNPF